jgi:hypothetical protein
MMIAQTCLVDNTDATPKMKVRTLKDKKHCTHRTEDPSLTNRHKHDDRGRKSAFR